MRRRRGGVLLAAAQPPVEARHQRLLGEQVPARRSPPGPTGRRPASAPAPRRAGCAAGRRAPGSRRAAPCCCRRGRAAGRPAGRGTGGRRGRGSAPAGPSRGGGGCACRRRPAASPAAAACAPTRPGRRRRGAPGNRLASVCELRAGVVVVDLVVVPDHQPRRGGVRRLQGRVALVLRVARAVVGQRAHRAAFVRAQPAGSAAAWPTRRCSRPGRRPGRARPRRPGGARPRSGRGPSAGSEAMAKAQRLVGAAGAGAVRVRPTALRPPSAVKRYQ